MSEPLSDYQRGYLDGVFAYAWRDKESVVRVGKAPGRSYQAAVNHFLGRGHTVTFSQPSPEGVQPEGDPPSAFAAGGVEGTEPA